MRHPLYWLVAVLLAVPAGQAAGAWQDDLAAVLDAETGSERDAALEAVVSAGPDWREVARLLEAREYAVPDSLGRSRLLMHVCSDGVERPWVVVVPESYDPEVETPLLVVLHGGVSRADIEEDPLSYGREHSLVTAAVEAGMIVVLPFGQEGATWWDEVGMANISDLVRWAKREHNIADDRVWMGGFSDGASASFLHAMVAPNDYGAFVALNGHMGVGSLDGDLATYAPNMAMTPVYAVTTFDDGLYPSWRMRPTVRMAQEAGADILYRELPGGHDFSYDETELPLILDFLDRHPRDPLPPRIAWETAVSDFGACRWLEIDRVVTGEPAPWHVDHNVGLVDDRVTIGFHSDYESDVEGVLVSSIVEGDYPASRIGLLANDVIVEADGMKLASLDDLDVWKSGVERGDDFRMVVLREGERVVLDGSLPEPANYLLFKRERPSGKVRALSSGNRVELQTSRIARLKILVHPAMFNLDEPVTVVADGDTVFHDVVEPSVGYMLQRYLRDRDRELLYVAEIPIELISETASAR
ncbi:MAG: PDZ domain-containing protein [Candidatus Eisenbacteria bacterium]|nr:PDZ domain-containing protein [Candidatus Eisenbacteria bacterium]